jgi:tetratricopeptide (TPR) repeat protein
MRLQSPDRAPRPRGMAIAYLSAATVAWFAALFAIVFPVVKAEAQAVDGDGLMRDKRPDRAARAYAAAGETVPWNADYAYRAARAALTAGDLAAGREYLDDAIAKDPMGVEYYLTRAGVALAGRPVDVQAVRADYTRALELNPADVRMRIAYADVLTSFGLKDEARAEYQIALDRNEGYDLTEPKRLSPDEIAHIKSAMGS